MTSPHSWLRDKKIGIWGMGREGSSSFAYLNNKGFNVAEVTSNTQVCDGSFDVIVKSPGISLYTEEVEKALANGITITSCTNLWFEAYPNANTIVVTGTKGKSTTTKLLHHALTELGANATLAGNMGVPLLDIEPADFNVIELSSYQLADLAHTPTVFVVLNLYPEHLQWHKTHTQYFKDKLSPLRHTSPPFCIAHKSTKHLVKTDIFYTSKSHVTLPIKGQHNQENAEAVCCIMEHLGFSRDEAIATFASFKQLEHRLEELEKDGVLYVNDSISTTPESTIAALEAYKDRDIILIIGGEDRGQDFSALLNVQKQLNLKHVIGLPDTGHIYKGATVKVETLEEAIKYAKKQASPNDAVILSPAAPSYNQFKNFEQRGNLFKKLV